MEHYYLSKKIVALALVAIVLSSVNIEVSKAQGICNVSGEGLMSCRPSVTPPNPTAPTSQCCRALSHADMACLCTYKNSQLLPSLGIDPKLAIQLPQKCRLPNIPPCWIKRLLNNLAMRAHAFLLSFSYTCVCFELYLSYVFALWMYLQFSCLSKFSYIVAPSFFLQVHFAFFQ